MNRILHTTFDGLIPRLEPALLPADAAQTAQDVDLRRGVLTPVLGALESGELPVEDPATLYRWRYRTGGTTAGGVAFGYIGEADWTQWAALGAGGGFEVRLNDQVYQVRPEFPADATTGTEIAAAVTFALRQATGDGRIWMLFGTPQQSPTDHVALFFTPGLKLVSIGPHDDAGLEDLSGADWLNATVTAAADVEGEDIEEWLAWEARVNVVPSPVNGDYYGRIYYTGDGVPRMRYTRDGETFECGLAIEQPDGPPTVTGTAVSEPEDPGSLTTRPPEGTFNIGGWGLTILANGRVRTTVFLLGTVTVGLASDTIRVQKKTALVTNLPRNAEITHAPYVILSVVPRISEYANTQNKVNAADFFSNHPFHLRVEEISRRIWAPSPTGSFKQTHWFYERTRGQYVNAQANLTPAGKRQFISQNPRSQVITKTDLAKFAHTFDCKPHWVSLGAQKNFARFASAASQDWERNERDVNDLYYRRSVAKALLFRELDRQVMRQPWYTCGYKANIVTYALAKLTREVADLGQRIDFDRIWEKQSVSPALLGLLVETARLVSAEIQNTDAGISNVTEWCKRELCWQRVERVPLGLRYQGVPEIIGAEAAYEVEVEARKTQVIVNGITAQSYAVERGGAYWQRMQSWLSERSVAIGPLAEGVLSVACGIPQRVPSEKQAKILLKVEGKARDEGFVMEP